MSEPKHTPGPWKYYFNPHDANNIQIFRDEKPLHVAWVCDSTEANTQRIVDCVNTCEGINPKAVPEMLEALKQAIMKCDKCKPGLLRDRKGCYKCGGGGFLVVSDPRPILKAIAKAEEKLETN